MMQLNGSLFWKYQILLSVSETELCSSHEKYTSPKVHSIKVGIWHNVIEKEIQ